MRYALLALAAILLVFSHLRAAEVLDIRDIEPDLTVPRMTDGDPAPGKRVRQTLPEYRDSEVYHALYLPTDWKPGAKGDERYPVLVEYAGNGPYKNRYGDVSTGLVEGSKLGYGISGGKRFLWLCLPYLSNDGKSNVTKWWGNKPTSDPKPTVDYCKKAVPWICEAYGGDPDRVILVGFSRGAIACNFIGLHDDEIARLWRAFVPFSHYDGVRQWGYPGGDRDSALARLNRLGDRPQFICGEGGSDGKGSFVATKEYLEKTGVTAPFTFRATGFRNHNDAWSLRPSPVRKELREWVESVLESK